MSMYMYTCMCASNSHLLAIETEWIPLLQAGTRCINWHKQSNVLYMYMYDVFLVVNFSGTRLISISQVMCYTGMMFSW